MALSSITTLGTIATPFANFVTFSPPVVVVTEWFAPLFVVNVNTPRPTIHRGWRGESTTFGGFEDVGQGAISRSIIVHANMKQPIVIRPMAINRVQFGGFE